MNFLKLFKIFEIFCFVTKKGGEGRWGMGDKNSEHGTLPSTKTYAKLHCNYYRLKHLLSLQYQLTAQPTDFDLIISSKRKSMRVCQILLFLALFHKIKPKFCHISQG